MFHCFRTSHIKAIVENPPIWLQRVWKIRNAREKSYHKKELILKAWRIFKSEDKLPLPNYNSPDANRHKYYSMQEMADKLDISRKMYNYISPQILKMLEAEKQIKKELINKFVEDRLVGTLENKNLLEMQPINI